MDVCENDKNDENENVYFWNNLGQWMTLSGVSGGKETDVQTLHQQFSARQTMSFQTF